MDSCEVSESWMAGHVTGCPDPRVRGAKSVVNLHVATVIGVHARLLEPKVRGARPPTDCYQDPVETNGAPVGQLGNP